MNWYLVGYGVLCYLLGVSSVILWAMFTPLDPEFMKNQSNALGEAE